MIHLNAKRIKKASGTKADKRRREEELQRRNENNKLSDLQNIADTPDVTYDDLTKDNRGVARSQANPWAKNKRTDRQGFWTDFTSSNIDGIDYDAIKKQLWVRFTDGSVYTYFDIPINVAHGFYTTSSKGHYFWEKIRKKKHIKYQKLHANRHWTYIPGGIDLSKVMRYTVNGGVH